MLPKQTPLMLPQLICTTCVKPMRVEIQKVGNGMISAMVGYCDTEGCHYRHNLQMQYAVGTSDGQYVPPEKKFTIPEGAPKFKVGEPQSMLTAAVKAPAVEKDGPK